MDRLNILYCSYRDWAEKILLRVQEENTLADITHITTTEELYQQDLSSYDIVFFIGWSNIIPKSIIENKPCICLHPSPLPKYRGGSPIQHQIIKGEIESKVSLFIMDAGIDTGDVVRQSSYSLQGDLEEVLNSIVESSYRPILELIEEYCIYRSFPGRTPQDDLVATYYKRRSQKMSEIKLEDFQKFTAKELHNKIRALQDPYPNAYIECKDGSKLYIKKSDL